ncbi:MAG TPA: DinB family protein [Pirellulales bacterium]|nr:DinB family protein [Pirellulales bacterium]
MNARQAIKLAIDTGDAVSLPYLEDLTDADMLRRPCPGCNHINWQVGHLIAAENNMLNQMAPGSAPPLPAGFSEKYSKEAATSDDASKFCKKDELLKLHQQQRAATLAFLDKLTDEKLDAPTGVVFAPTVGSMLSLQGSHWLMHAGQWVVVRRQLGRKPLF